jgi:hypothetical protein
MSLSCFDAVSLFPSSLFLPFLFPFFLPLYLFSFHTISKTLSKLTLPSSIDIMASKLAGARCSEDNSSTRIHYGTPPRRRGYDINPNEAERGFLKRDSFILPEPCAVHTARSTVVDQESMGS